MNPSFPRVNIFGLPISRMGMSDTVQYLANAVRNGQIQHVVTLNPIMIMDALEKPATRQAMMTAELLVPDGTGVVWAAERLGTPVTERVPGIDLLHQLLDIADREGWRVYLLGASDEAVQASYDKLRTQYPGANFTGYRNGFFTDQEDEAVIAEVRKAAPHLLFFASSASKQEPWLAKYKHQLGATLMMGVGGSFDVISGKLRRAPRLWQKLRLEWLFRLILQPWRIARMMALPKFMWKVLRNREKQAAGGM